MAADIRRLVWNTRERLTSTDLNTSTALHHRALIEALSMVLHGDTARFGVVSGLECAITGGTFNVTVSPGLAFRSSSAPTTYDSDIEWIELLSAETIDLTSYVDPTNPRWVCIEISESESAELSTSRDTWVPASGTFTSSAVDKVTGSDPTISVTAGTAAATPILPAGTSNRIPLAYIYIAGAAGSLTAEDHVHCRPLVKPLRADTWEGNVRDIQGGGVSVPADDTEVLLHQTVGRFAESHVPFSVGSSTGTVSLSIPAGGFDGGADPGADDVVYFYAIQPPYPAGYSATLATREFRPGSSALTRFPALVASGMNGCVVVASTSEPTVDSAQGFPSAGGNFTIASAPWTATTTTVARSGGMYLGSAFWDESSGLFRNQAVEGAKVYLQAYASTNAFPTTQLHNATVFIATGDVNLRNSSLSSAGGVANCCQLPITAVIVDTVVNCVIATATFVSVSFSTRNSLPIPLAGNLVGEVTFASSTGGGSDPSSAPITFITNSDGEVTFSGGSVEAAETDTGVINIYSIAYVDSVLSKR